VRISRRVVAYFPVAFSALALSGGLASAQTALGVMDRERPGYDAKGIPLGGFRLFPTLDFGAVFDDNVHRLTSAESDWYFQETPALRLQSQWGRHFLEFFGGADNYNYAKFSSLNLTDWNVGGDGRVDVVQGVAIGSAASYGEYHEPLYSPNTLGNQASPNRYHKVHGEITGTYQPNRLGVGMGVSLDRLTYEDAPLVGGGFIDNADRAEDEVQGYVRAMYNFSPGYTVFLKGSYDTRAFDQAFDRTGTHRGSHGYRVGGGVDLKIGHLLSGTASVGYLEQRFDQFQPVPLHNIAGLDFNAQLDWYAMDLVTVHLNAGRYVTDIVLAGVSASDDKQVKLSADYELQRNLLVQVYGAFTQSALRGINRTDNYPSAGISGKYLMNEYVSVNAGYNYSDRSSDLPGANYQDSMISIGLTGHI
jgi:hypothetical protein